MILKPSVIQWEEFGLFDGESEEEGKEKKTIRKLQKLLNLELVNREEVIVFSGGEK